MGTGISGQETEISLLDIVYSWNQSMKRARESEVAACSSTDEGSDK